MSSRVQFTRAWVEALPLASSEGPRAEYRDASVPRLVLRVGSRSKTYYVFTRGLSGSGRSIEKKVKLGDALLLTPQAARRIARGHLEVEEREGQLADRLDPIRLDDEFLTTKQAAELTGMSIAWFDRERWKGSGPPFYRAGHAVRYLKSELIGWWKGRRG